MATSLHHNLLCLLACTKMLFILLVLGMFHTIFKDDSAEGMAGINGLADLTSAVYERLQ